MADTTAHGARFSRPELPPAYDANLVPRVFGPWARVLLAIAAPQPGEAVLDVACGPGTVAREAAKLVGPSGRVTGADVSAAMLETARSKPVTPDMAPIEYVECPAHRLALPDGGFDLATCQYAFQLFPDREGAAAEMRRVLKPGGRAALATWVTRGPIPLEGLVRRLAEHGVDAERSGDFGSRPEELVALLAGAGFRDVRVERRSLEIVWEGGVDQLLGALPATSTGTALQQLQPERRAAVLDGFRQDLEPLVRDGQLRYTRESLITTARK